ncbi:sulfate permease [Diplonema papillatum]|nr:sulfate permease [Diplonema papillatum]
MDDDASSTKSARTPLLRNKAVPGYGSVTVGPGAPPETYFNTPSIAYSMTPMWAPQGFDANDQQPQLDLDDQSHPPLSPLGSATGGYHKNPLSSVLPAILAGLVAVVDNSPYGLVLFPIEIREEYKGVGLTMLLAACAIAQIVFTWTSIYPFAVACTAVENLPFLVRLGQDITTELRQRDRMDCLVPTLLFCFAFSSVASGLAMLFFGQAHAGRLTAYFPKHVLLGYVGGMGVFIFTAGFAVATDRPWSWNPITLYYSVAEGGRAVLLLTTLALVAAIPVVKRVTHDSTVALPVYFLSIPAIFWIVFFAFGYSSQEARDQGLVITVGTAPGLPGLFPWVLVDYTLIAWDVVAAQVFTIFGIVVFTILHVPVNVPALSLTTGRPCFLDAELTSHGVANLVCGASGGLQCYLAYGVSALYYKCGGGGKLGSLIIAAVILVFAFIGGPAMSLLPRPLAGCVLMHVGLDLMKEVFVKTLTSITTWEYLQVVGVVAAMEAYGFMEGLAFGLLLACFSYIMAAAQDSPIYLSTPAGSIRSSILRPLAERRRLNLLLEKQVWILRLKGGSLFFGNSVRLAEHCQEVLESAPDLRYMVLHFPEYMGGADCTAVASLGELVSSCVRHDVTVVFVELGDSIRRRVEVALANPQMEHVIWSSSINDAFVTIESNLLDHVRPAPPPRDDASAVELLQLLGPEVDRDDLNSLAKFFIKVNVREGEQLWRKGDRPTRCVIVASGILLADPMTNEPPEPVLVGSMAGELGLLTGEQRQHTLVAANESAVYIGNADIFGDARAHIAFMQIAINYASHRLFNLNLQGRIPAV